ncbi:9408_t:CDS:2 [Dentiscutata erythropus]|uniref:9408_t:CDS:1 n=1 Tax=Dentiscutata erythropus TaxID=1348616 RepID=A0A9N8VLH6_9GLOM|nr:9408_t:CDS:2 [Dentiscutata erythropus]
MPNKKSLFLTSTIPTNFEVWDKTNPNALANKFLEASFLLIGMTLLHNFSSATRCSTINFKF